MKKLIVIGIITLFLTGCENPDLRVYQLKNSFCPYKLVNTATGEIE